MACNSCGKRKLRQVNAAAIRNARLKSGKKVSPSGLTIAPAKSWLKFPPVIKPPGGWGIDGLPAKSPEDAADLLAGRLLAQGQFTHMKDVYARLNAIYCSRPGSPCYKNL
jgi:hypothetical protein